MQSAAPDLVDLKDESHETLDLYGIDKKKPRSSASAASSPAA